MRCSGKPRSYCDNGDNRAHRHPFSTTNDHSIMQVDESLLFQKRVHELLSGADGNYDEIFRSLGVT